MSDQKKKMALVIGNSEYGDGNDVSGKENAVAIADALEKLGFIVSPLALNVDLQRMNGALNAFAEQIEDADVVVLFYSGHGVQLENRNYLVPTDGSVGGEKLVLLEDALQRLGMAPNEAVKIAFLDACRNNKDLPDGAPKGLANPPVSPPNTLQAYAASPGQFAEGGKPTEKSVYTRALLNYLLEPGLELGNFFAKVRSDVSRFSDGQETFEAGPTLTNFSFRDPVLVPAVIPDGGHKPLVVILNGEVVPATDQPTVSNLILKAGENDLVLLVSNGRTFHNGFTWERTEGWSYQLDLQLPGQTVTFKDHEDHPFKAGPHHGGVFMVARATLFVDSVIDPAIPVVTLKDSVTDIANKEAPVWAQDQELLFEASIPSLNLSVDDILGKAVNLGSLALLLRPFLVEFLKTGKILGSKVADPDKTFVTVRGNKALKSAVGICMTQGREDRIRDLKASIAAAFRRVPNPFEVFDGGLNACLRATTLSQEISFNPEDIRIWTALEDRSRDTPATEVPDITAAATEKAAEDVPVVRAVKIPSVEALTAMAQDAILLPRPDEVLLDSKLSEQVVQGVPIAARIYTFFSIKPVDDHVQIHARAIADLSDLQNKIGALIDTIPLPSDNCSHFGLDNVVARIWGKQITVNGDVATLKLNGDVDVWTCAKNPVPCSRIEFEEKNVFGQTIRIPHLVFFDCNPPIKNRNLNQPFEATLPFTVGLVDPHTYALKMGDPDVNLGGALGGVTEGILKIAGVDINAKVKEALDHALSPEALKQKLPEFLLQYDPNLTRAELLSNSGALALSLEMEALLDAKQLGELIQMLLSQSEN